MDTYLCPQPRGTETYYRVLEIQLEREGIPVIGTRNNNVAVGSLFPLIQYIEIVKNEMILTAFSDSEDINHLDGQFGVYVQWRHAKASKHIKELCL